MGVFYLLQKCRCEYIPHVHRVQAMYTSVHRHLLTGCLPIITINVTCASALSRTLCYSLQVLCMASPYYSIPTYILPIYSILRGKVTVCCYGVKVSCTPFRHGTWETDTYVDPLSFALVVYIASVYFPCTMPEWGTTVTCTA